MAPYPFEKQPDLALRLKFTPTGSLAAIYVEAPSAEWERRLKQWARTLLGRGPVVRRGRV